jgi:hypothetical protein
MIFIVELETRIGVSSRRKTQIEIESDGKMYLGANHHTVPRCEKHDNDPSMPNGNALVMQRYAMR